MLQKQVSKVVIFSAVLFLIWVSITELYTFYVQMCFGVTSLARVFFGSGKRLLANILFTICTHFVGEIVSRLSADCQAMSHIVSTNVNLFLRNGVMLVGGLAYMFTLSWRLTLASFIFVPLIGYITKIYGAYYDVRVCI